MMDSSNNSMEKENVSVSDCYGFPYLNRRSQLRIEKQYKIINQEVKHLQESGIRDVIEGSNLLRSKLKACNNLSKTAFETASQKCIEYDGEYFLNASEVNHILLNSLQTDTRTFDPMVFAEKLITFINPDSRICDSDDNDSTFGLDDFAILGLKYSYLLKSSPCLNFIYGTFDPAQVAIPIKTRTRTTNSRPFDTKELKKPKTQDASEIPQDSKNGKEVEHIYTKIKKMYDNHQEPISYFKALVDRDSYTRTVENIFHSAFLIKEGLISLKYDNEQKGRKLPVVEPLCLEEVKSPKRRKNAQVQSILSFSNEDWKKWTMNKEN